MPLSRVFVIAFVALALTGAPHVTAQTAHRGRQIAATKNSDLREWDSAVDSLQRTGGLRLRQRRSDTLIPGRIHDRFDQYFHGVRVFGGDVARQTAGGLTVSLFGTVYEGIDIDTTPAFGVDAAIAAIERFAGAALAPGKEPELVILPRDDGGYALAYRARVFSLDGLFMYFVDAHSGTLLLRYNDLKTQAAIGTGVGVLGDTKKLSTSKDGSTYRADDQMRPPSLTTFDLHGSLGRVLGFLGGTTKLTTNDVASDSDNDWSDPAAVDAHAYAGWVYDFYYKRFGRHGLDNNNIPIMSIVHPANRSDVLRQAPSVISTFYLNAAYYGEGLMIYGEGLPSNLRDLDGHSWNYTSGALDVIAHELTHGVTEYSSDLIYRNESGALNEAFSDMMGTAAEFFFQPAGDGPLHADYLMGEDVITPGGIRSLANPAAHGDPDHFSRRYLGADDNGGVHTNSAIPTHAFYLAIEGGTNRTSRLSVEGVGGANREQIEKVMYRAFTQLMPSNATFAVARAVTLQSARDLYGVGSAAERAIAQAWTAVGIN